MDVLYLETDHDPVTKQVHGARRKVFTLMGAGSEVHLFGPSATTANFIVTCGSNRRWTLFSGLGHGDPDAFEGYGHKDVADVRDTPRTMAFFVEKIVHLYSCNTAKSLGPEMVKKGAIAFVGYNDYVIIASSASLEELFVSVSAVVDRSILAGDSHTTTKAKADAEYQRVRTVLTAAGSAATPTDVASFDLNFLAFTGPWTGSQYGRF